MMKDEAPYLLEWFAHHLALGFTDILVYTNDCTDGTDEMLIRLEELGLGHHRRNDIPKGLKPQPSALKHAQHEPLVRNADWVMVFDADEFLAIRHGDGTLDGMLTEADARGANGIVITWRIFGSGNVVEWSTAPVTEQYRYAAPPMWNKGWGVKTLFKFDPEYWKLGIHRPKIKNKHLDTGFPDQVLWLNGSGAPMEDYFKFRGWRSIRRTVGYNWAQLNHYALKSVDSYALRKMRGNVNNKGDKYNAAYWALQDRNEVRDQTILRHAAKRRAIVDQLLQDPVLQRLHKAALDRVEDRLATFKRTVAYRSLVTDLAEASKVPIGQVEAKPPQARDPAKIAALMSEVERRAQSTAKKQEPVAQTTSFLPAPIAIASTGDVEVFRNHALSLPADARVFTPDALSQIVAGKYARKDMRSIHWLVSDRDRLLSLGDEGAIVALQACVMRPGLAVHMRTARDDIAAFARHLCAENAITASHRLAIDAEGNTGDPTEKTKVLQLLMEEFAPTVLRLNDDTHSSDQLHLFRMNGVTKIIVGGGAKQPSPSFTKTLADLGFHLDPDWAKRAIWVFERRVQTTTHKTQAPSGAAR